MSRAHYSIEALTSTAYISLATIIFSICYPQMYKGMPVACYGCENKNVAREKYIETYSRAHETFFVIKSGLICTHHTFFGATPDGIINCSCCGPGVF